MCVSMSPNHMSVLCFVPAFKCVLKYVHISEVLLHARLELFIQLFLNVFLLADNYTVILVFKFFIVIKFHAIRGHPASV